MKKEKSCGCIVFNESSEVLVVQMNHGHWSFPKGHVENNETEEETALRETLEETGINCEIQNGFREVTTYSPKPGVIKDVVFFIAHPINEDITRQVEEIRNAEFIDSEKALDLITYDDDITILKKALKYYRS